MGAPGNPLIPGTPTDYGKTCSVQPFSLSALVVGAVINAVIGAVARPLQIRRFRPFPIKPHVKIIGKGRFYLFLSVSVSLRVSEGSGCAALVDVAEGGVAVHTVLDGTEHYLLGVAHCLQRRHALSYLRGNGGG